MSIYSDEAVNQRAGLTGVRALPPAIDRTCGLPATALSDLDERFSHGVSVLQVFVRPLHVIERVSAGNLDR